MSDSSEHAHLDHLFCLIDDGYPNIDTAGTSDAWHRLIADAAALASKLDRSAELFDLLGK